MKRHLLIYLTLLAAVALPSTVVAEPEARPVSWSDLKPVIEFEDPFEELSTSQLLDLSVLALVQEQEKQDPGAVDEGMLQKANEARGRLEEQKVDIDGLFSRRKEITELRTKQATATVPSLDGILVTLHGFVLPLEYRDQKVTEFLLVPWVGACIHTPPPAPNQIVHVVASEPFQSEGRFEAVTVTSSIKAGGLTKSLYMLDGSAEIPMSYSMNRAQVVKYKDKGRANERTTGLQ